jgi:CubicO group peptidase (beta-lactamase class C family)
MLARPTSRLRLAAVLVALLAVPIASTAPPDPLPVGQPGRLGFSVERLGRLHQRMRQFVDEGQHAGIATLIARHGEIVDWQAWGHRDREAKLPMEKDTIARVYSMTKIVTSAAILQLHEQARLRLDDPVERHLPALAKHQVLTGGTADAPDLVPATRSITIKDLLTHTSGYMYPGGKAVIDELYAKADVIRAQTMDEFVERLGRVPLVHQPGARFTYGVSTDVLGAVVEKVSGQRLDRYIAEHMTGPLRMDDTAFVVPPAKRARLAKVYRAPKGGPLEPVPDSELVMSSLDPVAMHWGGAGLFSTLGDFARFGQMLLNGGELDGVRVLGRKTVELMTTNALTHTPTPHTQFNEYEGFGLGGAVRLDAGRAARLGSVGQFGWSGAANTYFNIDPQESTVVVLFAQHMPSEQFRLSWTFSTLFYASLVDAPDWSARRPQ